jgi:putative component of membrane protein insertase Oxa1/YidC/SpoIIIJ protein YidD
MGFYRWGISLYQKHLSPKKGYRCSHSLEHGGPGCSAAILEILESQGFLKGMSAIKLRFASCRDAAQERKNRKEREKKERKNGGDSASGGCCITEGFGEAVETCIPDIPDCSMPDLPDCGSCDMSCSSIKFNFYRN